MSTDNTPTKYRIEIYEESYENDPTITFFSSTPFLSINVGDMFDPTCWSHGQPEDQKKSFKVTGKRHLLMTTAPSHNFHSLSILVELADKI